MPIYPSSKIVPPTANAKEAHGQSTKSCKESAAKRRREHANALDKAIAKSGYGADQMNEAHDAAIAKLNDQWERKLNTAINKVKTDAEDERKKYENRYSQLETEHASEIKQERKKVEEAEQKYKRMETRYKKELSRIRAVYQRSVG